MSKQEWHGFREGEWVSAEQSEVCDTCWDDATRYYPGAEFSCEACSRDNEKSELAQTATPFPPEPKGCSGAHACPTCGVKQGEVLWGIGASCATCAERRSRPEAVDASGAMKGSDLDWATEHRTPEVYRKPEKPVPLDEQYGEEFEVKEDWR